MAQHICATHALIYTKKSVRSHPLLESMQFRTVVQLLCSIEGLNYSWLGCVRILPLQASPDCGLFGVSFTHFCLSARLCGVDTLNQFYYILSNQQNELIYTPLTHLPCPCILLTPFWIQCCDLDMIDFSSCVPRI